MVVYLVWYYSDELSAERPAMWGIYATEEGADNALKRCGFEGFITREEVIQ